MGPAEFAPRGETERNRMTEGGMVEGEKENGKMGRSIE